ncbi:MAG: MFS transporter [Spirochaetaceae bacterium]|nr:MFS transporter [Spirochaetaceae bacterium]MCF7947387.1 MFS transporter [Spirochaetia bacterium]MCF7950323.1 MFS transporter [Spirochaetaceae bacterium]
MEGKRHEGPASLGRDSRLYVIFGITLIGVMGVAAIAPAFPAIAEQLSLSPRQTGLLITVFTVPGIVMAPSLGMLADRFGRRRIIIPSLLLFALAGCACAFIPRFEVLLALRIVQGSGASALTSMSVTLIGDLYSGERQSAAIGYNASVLSVGTAVYPALGGVLAGISWQLPFLLSALALPVGAAVALLIPPTARSHSPGRERPRGGQLGQVLRHAAASGILVLFGLGLLQFILLYGAYMSYVPFLLNDRFGASSGTTGAVMATMSLATALMASQNRRVTAGMSLGLRLSAAFVLIGGALALFVLLPRLLLIPLAAVLYGFGQGIIIPAVQGTIATRTPLELRASTITVNAMAIRIGQTVGPLTAGALYAGLGLNGLFLIAAGLALASALAAFLLQP